jgi:hypothetical protein
MAIEAKDIHDTVKALSDAIGPTKESIEVIKTLVWPLVVALGILTFRRLLSQLLRDLGGRITKLSAFHVEVELSGIVTPSISLAEFTSEFEDLTGGSFTPTTMMELLRRIKEVDPLYYLLVDIGSGQRWLISRLFLFSFVLWRIGAVRCVVFVETKLNHTRQLLGITKPESVCAILGQKYPWFQIVLNEVWAQLPERVPANTIELSRNSAEQLVQQFLDHPRIRKNEPPSYPADVIDEWEELHPEPMPIYWEHSKWLSRRHVDEDVRQVFFDGEEAKLLDSPEDPTSRRNLGLLRRQVPFVALVNSKGEMKYLVDREAFLRRVGVHFAQNLETPRPAI